ncbi:alpha-ketoglutarate-dependent dioxygenase AlkB [Sphingomonas gellani]|nr:alpha-ketoglutarate-dependent dioxygenase AlkB [Sphingomonas gellani]
MIQHDLFAAPAAALPPGLMRSDLLIGAEEQRILASRIDAEALTPFRFQGWLGKRLTRSFGWSYDFDRGRLLPGDPLPDWLVAVRDAVARFAGMDPTRLEQAMLIRYDPGAGIGWHKDRPAFDHVIGLSLGAACELRLRRRRPGGFDRASIPLTPGHAYLLSGEVRHGWEHSIAPVTDTRWSITFRSMASDK